MPSDRRNLLAVAALSSMLAAPAQPALAETMLKVVGPNINAQPYQNIVQPYWTKKVPELSKGTIVADVKSITELGIKGPEMFRMVKLGVFDVVSAPLGYTSGEVPENDGLEIAGLIQDLETLRAAVDAYRPSLNALLESRLGVTVTAMWPVGGQIFWCAVPISGLADLKGKKIRVFSAAMGEFVEAIGGVPVSMTQAEVVPALQRKVIDCAITGSNSGNVAKWTEVTTHIYPMIVGWSVEIEVASLAKWQQLPEPVRAFILENGEKVMAKRGWDEAEASTMHGIWCSVGDSRCDVNVTRPKPLTKTSLTLVPVSPADEAERKRVLQEIVIPRWAKRCGKACVNTWNKKVGPIVNLTAK